MTRAARWLPWVLTPLLLAYGGWLVQRAFAELTDTAVVEGLFRTYQPPRSDPDGWVIDARTGRLIDELRARYGRAPSQAPADRPGWSAALKALGFAPTIEAGLGDAPRLVFTDRGLWLQTGTFRGQPTLFDPARGLILLYEGALPPDVPTLAFTASEPAW